MANFNTHMAVAATASLAATGLCLQTGLATQAQALLLLPLGVIGGLLPDVDSDQSLPARLIFGLLGFAIAAALVFALYRQMEISVLLALAVSAGLFMRYVVLNIFARITAHRGLFHSLPAVLLAALAMLLVSHHLLHWSLHLSWLAAAFVGGGYLLHLLLDEFCSVDLMGGEFKQSFGSALTLFSPSAWPAYLLLYAVVGLGLAVLPLPEKLI